MRPSIPFSLVIAFLLAQPALAQALTPGVHDEAGFFKPDAIAEANKIISDVKQDEKKDLLIETFLHVPQDKANVAANPAFFKEWAVQRAREEQVNGIYTVRGPK